jgi:hypothetical protein
MLPAERIICLFQGEAEKGELIGEHPPVRNRMEEVPPVRNRMEEVPPVRNRMEEVPPPGIEWRAFPRQE